MIEISHTQARRLIRLALDRSIPDEQWNALQTHLERCAECLAYQERQRTIERSLRRGLRARWSGQLGSDTATEVMVVRRRRSMVRQKARPVSLALLVLLVVSGLALIWRSPASPPSQPAALPTLAVRRERRSPLTFRGEVIFQAAAGQFARSGNAERAMHIFLLSSTPAGVDLTDLTPGLTRATDPIWSPDGQWIAFLSDRTPEKAADAPEHTQDIYVINIAGTRLTRLTADRNIDWQGPLSWSADGRMIAAAGMRRDGSGSWIYLISLNGGAPRLLPHTRGATRPKFAPTGNRLAYVVGSPYTTFLRIYDDLSRQTVMVNGVDAAYPVTAGSGGAFDWSADGRSLVYVAHNPAPDADFPHGKSEIRMTGDLESTLAASDSSNEVSGRAVLAVDADQPLLSALSTFDRDLLYLHSAGQGDYQNGCAPLSALEGKRSPSEPAHPETTEQSAAAPKVLSIALPSLCVSGGLNRANEMHNWLVLKARTPDENSPGIYAVFLPDAAEGRASLKVERLVDLPAESGALQVRPDRAEGWMPIGPGQGIDPVPAHPRRTEAEPLVPPADLLSQVIITRISADGLTLARLKPDGNLLPLEAGKLGFCPRTAPDQTPAAFEKAIAFVSFNTDLRAGSSDIYRMDAQGFRRTQLTRLPGHSSTSMTVPNVHYGCPVWSPDGKHLAAWVDTGARSYLAIIPTDPEAKDMERYVPVAPVDSAQPRWSPDGRQVIVSALEESGHAPALFLVNVESGDITRMQASDGWGSIGDMAYSPDGRWLAYTAQTLTASYEVQAELRILGEQDGPVIQWMGLPAYSSMDSASRYGNLFWLPGEVLQKSLTVEAPAGASLMGVSTADDSIALEPNQGAVPAGSLNRRQNALALAFYGKPDSAYRSALLIFNPVARQLSSMIQIDEELHAVAWSPDGNWVVYSTENGLWVLNVPGALAGTAVPAWLGDEQVYELDWH